MKILGLLDAKTTLAGLAVFFLATGCNDSPGLTAPEAMVNSSTGSDRHCQRHAEKAVICYNAQTLTVSARSVKCYLNKGAVLGACVVGGGGSGGGGWDTIQVVTE